MALTFDDLLLIAKRTGVADWPGGQVVAAPSSWRGKRGTMGSVVGVTRHHTGTAETYKPTEDYPTYQVVKEGRSGLENSLSAFGLGRHRGIYVFSEYLSWHAGAWSYAGITDGNGHFLGIEAEGTGATWTPFQREFYPRLVASALLFIGRGADMMPRHADGAMPRGRKDDARNLPTDFTAKVQGYLSDPATLTYRPQEDDDMPLTDADIEKIAQRTRQVIADGTQAYGLDALRRQLDAIGQAVKAADANDSPERVAALVVESVQGASVGGNVDTAELGPIVEAAVRQVFGDAAA